MQRLERRATQSACDNLQAAIARVDEPMRQPWAALADVCSMVKQALRRRVADTRFPERSAPAFQLRPCARLRRGGNVTLGLPAQACAEPSRLT